jgi:hypothetical protein
LVRRLAQELACLDVEDALVSCASVAPNEVPPCRQAVFRHLLEQVVVSRLLCRIKDDPDVHHDVDEATLRRNEGAEVPSPLVEPIAHRRAGRYDHIVQYWIPGQVEPALVGRPEDEAEVVDVAIVLAWLK